MEFSLLQAVNVDNYNQVAVLPTLPGGLPRSISGHPLAHLFLKFHPSIRQYVHEHICGNGFKKNLISIKMLDQKLGQACALMLPEGTQDNWDALSELSEKPVHGKHTLQVMPFRKPLSPEGVYEPVIVMPEGKGTVLVGPRFPEYIIKQHIEEHFAALKSKIDKIEHSQSEEHSFVLMFQSLHSAEEAVMVFNGSLLRGIEITVTIDSSSRVTPASPSPSRQNKKAASASPVESPSKNVFVYSHPKFSDHLTNQHLLEHFQCFNPINAYFIKRNRQLTGVGKVIFPSEALAGDAIREMTDTELHGSVISMQFEDPDYHPKSQQRERRRPAVQATENIKRDDNCTTSSLKVSHLPTTITVQKLINLFKVYGKLDGNPVIHETGRLPYAHVNFKSKYAAQKAVILNKERIEGSVISVKEVAPRSVKTKAHSPRLHSEEDKGSRILKLSSDDWDALLEIDELTGLTLLDDLKIPYRDNPNVTIQLLHQQESLRFSGKKETVNCCFAYFEKQIKKELYQF